MILHHNFLDFIIFWLDLIYSLECNEVKFLLVRFMRFWWGSAAALISFILWPACSCTKDFLFLSGRHNVELDPMKSHKRKSISFSSHFYAWYLFKFSTEPIFIQTRHNMVPQHVPLIYWQLFQIPILQFEPDFSLRIDEIYLARWVAWIAMLYY